MRLLRTVDENGFFLWYPHKAGLELCLEQMHAARPLQQKARGTEAGIKLSPPWPEVYTAKQYRSVVSEKINLANH